LKNALLPVIAVGAAGGDVSAVVGFAGSEEHPAIVINVNPDARIAANSFFMVIFRDDFPIRILHQLCFANDCTELTPWIPISNACGVKSIVQQANLAPAR
jgi:adenosine/AMP kinase